MNTILAAIDLGPFSARVLRHAAGFARLFGARLKVLYVTPDRSPFDHARVMEACSERGPYEVDLADEDVVVRTGRVSDEIHREAMRVKARLVVIGSRGQNGLTHLFLGSTSEAVLRNAPAPVLLVPPVDLDIVNITDRATLSCGPVLAAVDLSEESGRPLQVAAELSLLARQPLLLMTVAQKKVDDQLASAMLRERAHALTTAKPHALIVRRGDVAEEIARCATTEGSGLVVMGLRQRPRGTPGVVASAVLKTKRAFVLAVPGEEAST
ncbi:MAG TPA: universal stress protein [Vicinamibacterales bacterium]|nr:universal stress protein [Vicinamibacterales bacterium]